MAEYDKIDSGYPKMMSLDTLDKMYSAFVKNGKLDYTDYEKETLLPTANIPENIVSTKKSKLRRTLENIWSGMSIEGEKTFSSKNFSDNWNMVNGALKIALSDDIEEKKAGKILLDTAKKNIEERDRLLRNKYFVEESDKQSLSAQFGGAVGNFSNQIATGLLFGSPIAIGAMAAQEFSGEMQKRLEKVDIMKDYDEKQAMTDLLGSTAYTGMSALLEKYTGLGRLINKVFKGNKVITKGLKGAIKESVKKGVEGFVSEGGTEFLQGTLSTVLRLGTGNITWEDLPEEMRGNVIEGVFGGILGGTSSVGFAIKNRSKLIDYIEQNYGIALSNGGKLDSHLESIKLADALLDEGTTAITKELVSSSQLGLKQGEIYEKLQETIGKAIEGKVVFENELDKQKFITNNAWRVADWTLSEAMMRNQPISEILNPDDIYFDGKGINLKITNEYQRIKRQDMETKEKALIEKLKAKKLLSEEKARQREQKFEEKVLNKQAKETEKLQSESFEENRKTYTDLRNAFDDITIEGKAKSIYDQYKGYLKQSERGTRYLKNKGKRVLDVVKEILNIRGYKGIGNPVVKNGQVVVESMEELDPYKNIGSKKGKKMSYDDLGQVLVEEGLLKEDYLLDDLLRLLEKNDVIEQEQVSEAGIASDNVDFMEKEYGINKDMSEQEIIQNIRYKTMDSFDYFELENIIDSYVKENFTDEQYERFLQDIDKNNTNYVKAYKNLIDETFPEFAFEGFFQKQENLDDIYPEYTGETININGVEKTVYNSDGTRIAKSKEALENFYNWFGDSKVVDEQGRPLVVYHGTNKKFDTFDKSKFREKTGQALYGDGFYFTSRLKTAEHYAYGFTGKGRGVGENNVISAYLKAENPSTSPKYYDEDINDSVIKDGIYFVKEPNQIKSIDNRGTFSLEDDNIYRQGVKGSFNPSTYLIKLTQNADYSTLPHEFAHFFLQSAIDYINSGNASESYTKRFDDMMNEFRQYAKNPKKQANDTQEFFARQYERYLLENKAETEAQKEIFNDFERWLKAVYNDVNIPQSEPLSQAQIDYFNSHITENLQPPVNPVYSAVDREKEKTEEKVNIQGEKMPVESSLKTETTDEKEKVYVYEKAKENKEGRASRVYDRFSFDNESVNYDPVILEEQAQMATNLVENDIEKARKIIDGELPLDEDMLRTPLLIAYEDKMAELGNIEEYNRVRFMHSLEQTRRGQELVSENIGLQDWSNPSYWLNKIEDERYETASKKLNLSLKDSKGESISPKIALENWISERVKRLEKEIKEGREDLESAKAIIKDETNYDGDLLFQKDEEVLTNASIGAKLKEAYRTATGVKLENAEARPILQQVEKLVSVGLLDNNGRFTDEGLKEYVELRKLAQRLNPSSNLNILLGTSRTASLLSGVGSYLTNRINNFFNELTEKAVVQLEEKRSFSNNYIPEEDLNNYKKYVERVYNISSLTVPTISSKEILHPFSKGEKGYNLEGEGYIRKTARLYNKIVFDWALGKPDMQTKLDMYVFASKIYVSKYIDKIYPNYTLEQKQKEASRLFKEMTNINTLDKTAAKLNEMAKNEAMIATLTQDGVIAEGAMKLREGVNKIMFNSKIGNILAPFVKVPANAIEMQLKNVFGLPYSVVYGLLGKTPEGGKWNIEEIIKDFRSRKEKGFELSETSKKTLDYAVRGGFAMLIASLLSLAFDDDDYIPPYELASAKDRDIAKMKNAPFNSINIGGKYVSLDLLGGFASPLSAVLQFKKNLSFWQGLAGAGLQFTKIPLFGDVIPNFSKKIKEIAVNDERIGSEMADYLLSESENIALSLMSPYFTIIEKNIGNLLKESEKDLRQQSTLRRIVGKTIPATAPDLQSVSTGGKIERSSFDRAMSLLFGGRYKGGVDNELTRELTRLNDTGNAPTMTDVLRSKSFGDLSVDERQEIAKEITPQWNKAWNNLISKSKYIKASDEEKKKMLNDERNKIFKKYIPKKR